MKIQHLRNATALITLGEHFLLLDPMFAKPASFPGFKLFGGGRRRNPRVPMPAGTNEALERVTGVLVTHEHLDHLDIPALRWIRERGLPVWSSPVDAPNLKRKGLDARALPDDALGFPVEVVPARHGRGLLGWLMGPVAGFYLAHPEEPSLYITGDTVLTPEVMGTVRELRPDLVLAPAGAANFGLGGDILFSVDELVMLIEGAPGEVILNHLEAIDHCPTTRTQLRKRIQSEGLSPRVLIPEDGEAMHFERRDSSSHAAPRAGTPLKPGFQKWLTAWFTGT